VRQFDGNPFERFVGRAAEMRRRDNFGMEMQPRTRAAGRRRFVGDDVDCGAGNQPRIERFEQRRFVDHATTRAIDQQRVRLHQCELRSVDEAERLTPERHVQRDDVGARKHVVERHELGRESLGARARDERIGRQQVHAEGGGAMRDCPADPSEPDDAERLAGEFGADERLAFPVPGPNRRDGARGVAHERKHQREGLFGRGERVRPRGIEDDDAGVGRCSDVDRVDADAGPRDDRELRAES